MVGPLISPPKPSRGYTVGIIANLMWGEAMLRAQGRWAYTDLEPMLSHSDALTWVGPTTEGPYKDMSVKQLVRPEGKAGHAPVATFRQYVGLHDRTGRNDTGAKFYATVFRGAGPASMPWQGETSPSHKDFLLRVPGPSPPR